MADQSSDSPTIEEILEPELQICDAHHHLWDMKGSRYLVDELRQDINGHRVTKTVYVECQSNYYEEGSEHLRSVGETAFVDQITAHCQDNFIDTPHIAAGIVAYGDLRLGKAVDEVLERHSQASSRFRGIRHATAWDPSDRIHKTHTNPSPNLLADSAFREGFSCLGKRGLTFDAWIYFHQLPEITDLARAYPETPIILNHVGGPIGIGPYKDKRNEVFSIWRKYIIGLSECRNVFVKLGGLTMAASGFGWNKLPTPASSIQLAEAMSPYYHHCIQSFGPARCMFESNFPIDRTGTSYHILWNAFKRISSGYSMEERAALFHDTAARIYRLGA